jgi:glycosyltransferase involved in cell wall biosynthesis
MKKISILLLDQSAPILESVFSLIFSTPSHELLEVVYVDEGLDQEAWSAALRYAKRYEGAITISRNRIPLGFERNYQNALRLATTEVYAVIDKPRSYEIENLLREIEEYFAYPKKIETSFLKFDRIDEYERLKAIQNLYRLNQHSLIPTHKSKIRPHVSITVHNQNYGRYLYQCLDSVMCQTYAEISVLFSDNASTDDSWDIVQEFVARYPKKITVTRNRINLGSRKNIENCEFHVTGEYYLQLCSDDYLHINCIEKCISALKTNSKVNMLIFHRGIADAEGKEASEPPFFSKSFEASPEKIAEIYYMASINPSISQVIYSTKVLGLARATTTIDRWFANRFRDFVIALDGPVMYLKDALVYHRIHGANDNLEAAKTMMEVIGPYVANLEFDAITKERGINLGKKERWCEKLASLALRYACRALSEEEIELADRYLHLAIAMDPKIRHTTTYKRLKQVFLENVKSKQELLFKIESEEAISQRRLSYEPPTDARLIDNGL